MTNHIGFHMLHILNFIDGCENGIYIGQNAGNFKYPTLSTYYSDGKKCNWTFGTSNMNAVYLSLRVCIHNLFCNEIELIYLKSISLAGLFYSHPEFILKINYLITSVWIL